MESLTLGHWLVIAFILGGLVWSRSRRNAAKSAPRLRLHCMDCGSAFHPEPGPARGSLAIEVVMYFFLILPGIMYSIWRRSGSGKRECIVCGSTRAIPFGSPAAVAHRKTLGTGSE